MSTTIHIDNNQTITITANTTTLADLRDAINLKGTLFVLLLLLCCLVVCCYAVFALIE